MLLFLGCVVESRSFVCSFDDIDADDDYDATDVDGSVR